MVIFGFNCVSKNRDFGSKMHVFFSVSMLKQPALKATWGHEAGIFRVELKLRSDI